MCDTASWYKTPPGDMPSTPPPRMMGRPRAQSLFKAAPLLLTSQVDEQQMDPLPSRYPSAVGCGGHRLRSRVNALQKTSAFALPLFGSRQRSSTWHGAPTLAVDYYESKLPVDSHCSCGDHSNEDGQRDAVVGDRQEEKQAIQEIVCDVLYTELLDTEYDEGKSEQQCTFVAECVRARVREAMDNRRAKVVITASIGQQCGPDPIVASCQCLWEVTSDKLINVNFQNGSLFAICSVFVVECP